ncbi:MAG TPA: TIGR02449 family protein [Pseudomonas sp.]|nr:TIGR02449 family protein [Pseudomonas sp.]
MENTELQRLAAKLDELLDHYQRLKAQNRLLLAHEKAWREERTQLIEKNEQARQKVEAMISRLKALEQDP